MHLTKRHTGCATVRYEYIEGLRSFVGMGILWGFPQVCCGYGMKMGLKFNPHAALVINLINYLLCVIY